jgi:hypothetical protein
MVNWLVLMETLNYDHYILRALAHEGFIFKEFIKIELLLIESALKAVIQITSYS